MISQLEENCMKSARRRPSGSARRRLAAVAGIIASSLALSSCAFPWTPQSTERDRKTSDPSIAESAPDGLQGYYSQDAGWTSCEKNFECGNVRVPMDYANPGAGDITIAAIRLPSKGKQKGSILINPGGPGASGYDYVKDAGQTNFTEKLRANYDIVGFDPRGVKRSAPVTCLNNEERDASRQKVYRLDTDQGLQAALADNKAIIDKCVANSGPALAHIDTASSAKDMDILRAVLNDSKLNYIGYSYGTSLGSTYASLFPDKVGRMVLDGAMDPSLSNEELTSGQARAFEKAIRSFVSDCLRDSKCPLRGSVDDGVEQVRDLINDVDQNPRRAKDGRLVTGPTFVSGVITPLYNDQNWPVLSQALDLAMQGDVTQMLRIADLASDRELDGSYSGNSSFAFNAINCLDYPMVSDTARMRADAEELKKDSPTFGYFFAYGGINCKDWPYKSVRTPAPVEYDGGEPIVVIGTTGDPATPVEWAGALRKQLGNASLITWHGEGHTAYGRSNHCVSDAVDSYFVDGKQPADNTQC
jgi:pimeloyl-ACP methyl ester carboxylesterase